MHMRSRLTDQPIGGPFDKAVDTHDHSNAGAAQGAYAAADHSLKVHRSPGKAMAPMMGGRLEPRLGDGAVGIAGGSSAAGQHPSPLGYLPGPQAIAGKPAGAVGATDPGQGLHGRETIESGAKGATPKGQVPAQVPALRYQGPICRKMGTSGTTAIPSAAKRSDARAMGYWAGEQGRTRINPDEQIGPLTRRQNFSQQLTR